MYTAVVQTSKVTFNVLLLIVLSVASGLSLYLLA